jgi:hypothetical protein
VARASGEYSPAGDGWIRVLGPTSVYCTEYPVEFLLPNGTSVVVPAPFNKTFVWTPPPIVYPNGTRLEADPVAVFVDRPMTARVNYTRVYYLMRVVTPLGVNETWAPRGAAASAVGLPDPWDLPNGTRFAGLLINNTAQREFRVDRPMTLRAQYAEVYYWAVVETPVNKTAGWMPKGAVLKFPDTVDFGNGTQLIKPSVREAVVDRLVLLKVEYAKRQYYVKIEGVNRWEGWADAGAVVRLNATVVDGVEYTPAEVVTAWNPGVYRPMFYAVYKTAVRDVLGVPNPLATVKLCDAAAQAGLDGSAVVAAYTRELCQPTVEAFPISPYTAAVAATAATAAALALKRRKK